MCDGFDNDCDGWLLPTEVDEDLDGQMYCIDCNDNHPAVYVGAPEICDGLDNNCNGTVDDGLSGETFTGNAAFTSQTQLNDWPACYSTILGNMIIMGADMLT